MNCRRKRKRRIATLPNGINQFDFYHRTGFSIEKSAKYPLSSGMIFLKMTIYTTMFIFELSYILWY